MAQPSTSAPPSDLRSFSSLSIASALDATRGGIHFIVVGCGGNGARVVPPLMQILNPTDHLSLIDHDVVEDRNLGRQHFSVADVGRYKALVLAERYRRRQGGQDIGLSAHTVQLTEENAREIVGSMTTPARTQATVFIGCVDNAAARRAIVSGMRAVERSAWIDVGNAFKDGQVVLSLRGWPMTVKGDGVALGTVNVTLAGMQRAMPQLLVSRPEDAEELSCRERVDLQSVMINVQAASAALNVASWLKLKSQIMNAGAFFSSMCVMQPIKFVGFSAGRAEVFPETSFAAQD